ncbi:uncharacterized protein LOC107794942 [Nicotiana tabacum]|uniref:Uncharacterized protein LOC107794942 n=2 Tax=Nicotiana TaxID=4085 RepID=A0A1S4A8T7_TOBAC|nr:PREDICTED: uncharacterized protein LOC104210725 [Nicotiana sylvestris]XP_016472989.1 PREDICTED: uncharacterized protein LOC107794942 [Nicotiana tabacum]
MEKANRKTHGSTDPGAEHTTTGKRAKMQNDDEEEEEGDMMAWLSLDDEKMTELSNVLDPDTASFQQSFRVRFIENPYIPPVIVQSSSGYITINGNEESCGSSFSDLDSSAMASVDRGSLNGILFEAIKGKGVAWGSDADEAGGWMEENGDDVASWSWGKQMDDEDLFGCYGGEKMDDDDDEASCGKFLGEDLFGNWDTVENW